MTKPKAKMRVKSDATIIGQLNEPVNITNIITHPGSSPTFERLRLTASTVEERLADRIRSYWGERGYYIDISVQDIYQARKPGTAEVVTSRAARSNLVNGLPVGYKDLSLGIASCRRQGELLREMDR